MRIELEGAVNVRDAGGSVTADGGRVALGRLLRSETPEQYTEADVVHMLQERGVTLVVDLREATQAHDESGEIGRRVRRASVDFVSLSGGRLPPGPQHDAHRWLEAMLPRIPAVWVAFLEALCSNTTGATLVHCQSGKDRTGLMVALTLRLLGVSDDDLRADYLASAAVHDEMIARLSAAGRWNHGAPAFVQEPASAEGFDLMLARLDADWPDLYAYLAAGGASPDLAARVRAHLLV